MPQALPDMFNISFNFVELFDNIHNNNNQHENRSWNTKKKKKNNRTSKHNPKEKTRNQNFNIIKNKNFLFRFKLVLSSLWCLSSSTFESSWPSSWIHSHIPFSLFTNNNQKKKKKVKMKAKTRIRNSDFFENNEIICSLSIDRRRISRINRKNPKSIKRNHCGNEYDCLYYYFSLLCCYCWYWCWCCRMTSRTFHTNTTITTNINTTNNNNATYSKRTRRRIIITHTKTTCPTINKSQMLLLGTCSSSSTFRLLLMLLLLLLFLLLTSSVNATTATASLNGINGNGESALIAQQLNSAVQNYSPHLLEHRKQQQQQPEQENNDDFNGNGINNNESLLSSSSSSSSSSLFPASSSSSQLTKSQQQFDYFYRQTAKQTAIGQNITRILNAFFDSGYDKRVRPNYAGPPVQVGVTMHIISISSISAVQMDFTSDFYFRQSWRDSRLSFKPQPGIQALYVGAEVSEKIWVPDTFFANEKSAQFHMATTPNTFIRIKSNGDVFLSMRLTVTSSCPMNLQYFPMDRQSCTIEVESYGYSMADIQYKWGIDGQGSDVVLAKNLELPQFKVYKHLQRRKVEVLSTGNYSRLVCEIEFVRSMGYYLIQIYIPASLIVIISWVSFWLHRNASPARVQLGVTTVLTMTTLMSSTNAAMPKISYIKSIDVFLGTCFVMVFAALLEYATVGYMGKRIAMRKSRTQQIVRMLNEHREKCIAAAAAAAHEAKDLENRGDDSDAVTVRRHGALIRTASLYPNMEQLDELESYQKRGLRSHGYGHHYNSGGHSGQFERSASLKSRMAYATDNGDDPESGPNFNDDLNVFVAANSGSTTAVGGSSSPFYTIDHHGQSSSHYQERDSSGRRRMGSFAGLYGETSGRDMRNLAERAFLPSSYFLKNQNTLFGVCPSDIDKYSRVVFPVCFLCFNLMYWIIYMHISEFLIEDQQFDGPTQTDDSR